MFSVAERERARNYLLDLASRDDRIVAGAFVGGSAEGEGDRWSDIDLTLGVADDTPPETVLADWTAEVARDLGALHLFDLPFRTSIYRVFLLPGCLQVDLSFTPASDFGAYGPRFTLLFGEAVEKPHLGQPSAHDRFGLAVHHAVRGRFSIERGRSWQAEYWISSARDEAFALACLGRGLETEHGSGLDELPSDVLARFDAALVRSLEPSELRRALAGTVAALLEEAGEARDAAERLELRLQELVD
jgi:hypothetical protein